MKEIGGYFELELSNVKEYHQNAVKLNSARSAFQYILKTQNISKVYLPAYTCDSVVSPLNLEQIEIQFYKINKEFEIIGNIDLMETEKLYYINYFGLKNNYINNLISQFGKQLIVDNSQAFFDWPHPNIDTLYSPRKFFGVSDGGYLYTNFHLNKIGKQDVSTDRVLHLIGRIDQTATKYYSNFISSENYLNNQKIRTMSKFTQRVLKSIDYQNIKLIRERNFLYLHSFLAKYNLLEINLTMLNGPMIYPFLCNDASLKSKLIENKIYVATYWPEVRNRASQETFEVLFVNNLIPLPIDQRYSIDDMLIIINIIYKHLQIGISHEN